MFGCSAPTLKAISGVRAILHAIGRARSPECLSEACRCPFVSDFHAPFPVDAVHLTSIYSKGDGVVDWRRQLVPYADCVEVTGSHVGLIFNRASYRAIAAALAVPERSPTPRATDYFFLRVQLTDQQLSALRRVRTFVDEEVLPAIAGYWGAGGDALVADPPHRRARRVGEDIVGYCLDPIACGLVHMELGRGDGSVGTFLGVHSGLAMKSIAMLGSDEQKQRWVPAMARLEKLGAFALTEPRHGSDSVALETTARRAGDHFVIDGAKRWIGNGSLADVVVVWARGDDGRVNGFLVDVPVESKPPGASSFKDAGRVLASTRVTCAWAALGHAVAAYDSALTYAMRREQFGKPLVSFQIVQDRLVRMLAEVTSMQDHVIRHMTDIEAIHTDEGTETMQTLIVGRDITGVSAFA